MLYNIIEFLNNVNELKLAENLLDVFAKYSNNLQQYDELGRSFEKIKQYNKALLMLEKCLIVANNPEQLYNIRCNLAKVYNHLNDPQKSIFYSNINLEINPNDPEMFMEQSFSNYLYGDFKTSYDIQVKLLKDPNVSDNVKKRITFNMGTFEMQQGNFKVGLYKMINGGKEIGIWKSPVRSYEKWNGQDTNKTLLVFAEAGIGDEFINIRFLNNLKHRGIKHHYIGFRPDIVELFQQNGFNACLEKDIDPLGDYVYCDAMNLPILLDIGESQLWQGPYLAPKQSFIDKWKAKLPEKFITIKYSGNPFYDHDLHRTLPLERLYDISREFNITAISLQIDDGLLFKQDIQCWDDTLAIQHLAALNVTSCTSTAHSASAIGARCVVIPPICRYYPWVNLTNDHSPWYGESTKIFPQVQHKNWDKPFEQLRQEMRTL